MSRDDSQDELDKIAEEFTGGANDAESNTDESNLPSKEVPTMMMPSDLKELQRRLEDRDMACVPSGKRSLSDEVYPAVKKEFAHLCLDVKCSEVCSAGANSEEWKHRVRTVLSGLADESRSRVHRSDDYGMWRFR